VAFQNSVSSVAAWACRCTHTKKIVRLCRIVEISYKDE
jgi:hypothetical protein